MLGLCDAISESCLLLQMTAVIFYSVIKETVNIFAVINVITNSEILFRPPENWCLYSDFMPSYASQVSAKLVSNVNEWFNRRYDKQKKNSKSLQLFIYCK